MKQITYAFLVVFLTAFFFQSGALHAQEVFFNEVNYMASNPQNRGYEVAGPAGTDLSGYELVGYDDQGEVMFTKSKTSTIPDQQNGHGSIWYDVDQAYGARSVAMTNSSGDVVQYVSYGDEASQTQAVEGPASGMTPEYIGEQTEPSKSLQLTGEGNVYEDFVWDLLTSTPGYININQLFLGLVDLLDNLLNGLFGGWFMESDGQPNVLQGEAAEQLLKAAEAELNVYPNPTADVILIKGLPVDRDINIKVVNVSGQRMQATVVRSGMYEIDVRALPAGTYWIQIETNYGFIKKPFVKK